MSDAIDESVYPDVDPPAELGSPEARADYLHRICGAFDFGIVPERATLKLFAGWREVFDRFPLKASPAYHALRAYYGWPALEQLPYLGTLSYIKLDRLEDREDGFEDCV